MLGATVLHSFGVLEFHFAIFFVGFFAFTDLLAFCF